MKPHFLVGLFYFTPTMKYILILLTYFFCHNANSQQNKYHLEGFAQGTSWLINYYNADSIISKSSIDSIFSKIDSSLSLYKPYSLINQFNQSPRGIIADSHFIKNIQESLKTYRQTRGAFDLTYKCKCKGSEKIAIINDSVIKLSPEITIDANGIAQGYTVDVIANFLLHNNISNFIVELGGEIKVSGRKPAGELFKIGIESATAEIEKIISLPGGAITTSGNYRKKDHIVNPSTGNAVANELVSVTVYAKDAVTADAYDNALMVMGLKRAIKFTNKHKQIAAHFIYRKPDGSFAEKQSRGFRRLFK